MTAIRLMCAIGVLALGALCDFAARPPYASARAASIVLHLASITLFSMIWKANDARLVPALGIAGNIVLLADLGVRYLCQTRLLFP